MTDADHKDILRAMARMRRLLRLCRASRHGKRMAVKIVRK